MREIVLIGYRKPELYNILSIMTFNPIEDMYRIFFESSELIRKVQTLQAIYYPNDEMNNPYMERNRVFSDIGTIVTNKDTKQWLLKSKLINSEACDIIDDRKEFADCCMELFYNYAKNLPDDAFQMSYGTPVYVLQNKKVIVFYKHRYYDIGTLNCDDYVKSFVYLLHKFKENPYSGRRTKLSESQIQGVSSYKIDLEIEGETRRQI